MECSFEHYFLKNGSFHLFLSEESKLLFCESPSGQVYMARKDASSQQPIVLWKILLANFLTVAGNEKLLSALWKISSQKHPE